MVARILTTIFMVALSILILKFTEPIVNMVGRSDLAERYLGQGGTYTMWKILGVIIAIASFFVLTGQLRFGPGAL